MALVHVDIDLDEFDTPDLVDELRRRGNKSVDLDMHGNHDPIEGKNATQLADALYEARRNGNDARALELCDRLIYAAIGRIV